MSQHDDDQVFTDHLGNERPVDIRNDIFSHRIMAFLKGWMGSEKLIYNITIWTVNTTDQDAIFANLGYQFSRKFSLYAGLAGNPGSRSLSGSHPFWLGHDRVMADEFFRPFFGSGIYAHRRSVAGPLVQRHRLEQQQRARREGQPARPQAQLRRHGLVDADDARVRPARRVWRLGMARGCRDSLRRFGIPEPGTELSLDDRWQSREHHAAPRRQREPVRDRARSPTASPSTQRITACSRWTPA